MFARIRAILHTWHSKCSLPAPCPLVRYTCCMCKCANIMLYDKMYVLYVQILCYMIVLYVQISCYMTKCTQEFQGCMRSCIRGITHAVCQRLPLSNSVRCANMSRSVTKCSLKSQVSFAKEPYTRDCILQKRPLIWRSLLIVATAFEALHMQFASAFPSPTVYGVQICHGM